MLYSNLLIFHSPITFSFLSMNKRFTESQKRRMGEGLGVSSRGKEKRPQVRHENVKKNTEKNATRLAQLATKYKKETQTEVTPYASSKILRFLSLQMDHKRA